ncbi:MAG: efflux RND transporter periplasmic adaptor subunit [Akkermansiaceae bacterium]
MSEESEIAKIAEPRQGGVMRSATRWLIIVVVIAIGMGGFVVLKNNGPEADKEQPPRVIPVVRVITAQSGEHQLKVATQGRVDPKRRTQAASEVMGRVIKLSDKFKPGGIFMHTEVMLEIDSSDYVSALANAEASQADAKLLLDQEEARSEQAKRDWAKLGRGTPSDLVLRKPQIASAKARVAAAEAAVAKAVRDLERTKLRAPYDCRIEATYTDLGSYIARGARLADLYSQNFFEVRMPVTMEETGYISVGEDGAVGALVDIEAELAGKTHEWSGKIIRSEGMVDRNTMTTHYVMEVKPKAEKSLYSLPPSGLVVRALITGRKLQNVIEIPRSALRQDNTVLTLTNENKLKTMPVKIARTTRDTVIISSGIPDGTKVIVSPIEMPVDGMEVAVEEAADAGENKTP